MTSFVAAQPLGRLVLLREALHPDSDPEEDSGCSEVALLHSEVALCVAQREISAWRGVTEAGLRTSVAGGQAHKRKVADNSKCVQSCLVVAGR